MVQAVLLSSVGAALVYLAAVVVVAVAFALKQGGRREDPVDDHDALAASRFTIPVSLIVPLSVSTPRGDTVHRKADSTQARDFFADLLDLHYPEFEVIVVADEQHPRLDRLKADWGFSAHEFFYRKSLATAEVRRIYRSSRDPRLMLVEKRAAGRADAVNCGVNLARYRYVSAIDAGIVFDPDSLLRAMAVPLKNPAAVVGASSHVEMHDNLAAPRLASIRSLMLSRMVRRAPHAVPAHDAVVVWRRDATVQVGGFSTDAADADLDMTIRVQASSAISGHVVRSAEIFGHIDRHLSGTRLELTTRRQLAALQAARSLWALGAPGSRTLAFVLATEVLTPVAQAWAVAATALGAAVGWVAWRDVVLVLLLLSLGRAVVSGAALLLRGSTPGAPDESTLTRLLLFAPLEFVLSAPAALIGRAVGVWSFVTRA
jgi:hypothetical protein